MDQGTQSGELKTEDGLDGVVDLSFDDYTDMECRKTATKAQVKG